MLKIVLLSISHTKDIKMNFSSKFHSITNYINKTAKEANIQLHVFIESNLRNCHIFTCETITTNKIINISVAPNELCTFVILPSTISHSWQSLICCHSY